MIRMLDGMPAGVLGIEAVGKLTAEDYTGTLAPALDAAIKESGKVRIVIVFRGEFEGMEPGAAWQDLKMGVRDWNAWERIALVTDHAWMKDGLRLFAWAVPGEARAFGLADQEAAVIWAAGIGGGPAA
ncbi:STAS/SEC14 domain-containing protein [Actinomadura barringtoniae]|uniref:STAS/SEC14 domain-containing protein n=1 Tax=Actinomadura barringtoniae TaxID=1427535 RepID=A0A939PJB8_9ACTN|nr:STAS/SEC14 domain-containing protein [Actinomadura barringtoniae]MBO2453440.1 STAS/SEC14 domain-containing protein [Actinomadura barringtoniae]